MPSPTQQTVIVTGAGKGLGRAYAVALASQGANVLVNNRRHPGEGDEDTSAMATVLAIRARGGTAEPNYADVTDPASGPSMVAHAMDCYGQVDAVVANAGIEKISRFEHLSLDEFQQVFNTSFFGNLYLVQAAWRHWLNTGAGRAVLTTSGAGLYGNHGQSAYSAAKAAVIGLTKALSIEGASRNIKVNALAPYAHTAMTKDYLDSADSDLLAPEKVAPLVNYLTSAECDLSGEILIAGGGLVRAARMTEEAALPIEADITATIAQLRDQPKAAYASANESFLDLKFLMTDLSTSADATDR